MMKKFLDTSTLADRLKDTESIAVEYRAQSGSWHLARFIVKKRNTAGDSVTKKAATGILLRLVKPQALICAVFGKNDVSRCFLKTKKDVLSRLNRRFLLLSKNTGQHPLRTADAWKELSWCGPGTAPVCPYPSAAFSQRPPLLRIFHRSCCLKLWRALPECTVLTGGQPSCRRRRPLSVPERRTQPS